MIQLSTSLEKFESNLWYFHFKVPRNVVSPLDLAKDRRIICTINEDISFHCALMPDGNDDYFINVNKEIRKKLKLEIGTKVELVLVKDESKYGMAMPQEFGELLEMEPETDQYFHKLTPGKQRALIHLVAKPKQSDTRIRKAVAISEYLKLKGGNLDFKELNQFFKDFTF